MSETNGKPLTEALATLALSQAQLVQAQAQMVHNHAALQRELGELHRDVAQVHRDLAHIAAVLNEHSRILAALPDAVGDRIGFPTVGQA